MATTQRITKHIIVVLEDMDQVMEREFLDAFVAEGLTGYEPPAPRQPGPGKRGKRG